MSAFLWNTSDHELTLEAIELAASPPDGSVVDVKRIEIAPLPGTHGNQPPLASTLALTPGGIYKAYPPVFREGPGKPCHKQALEPVAGFLLGPEEEARILIWLRTVSRGAFRIRGPIVSYEQDGLHYQQLLPSGVRGSVENDGSGVEVEDFESVCAKKESARLLPSG